jgi:hypothetical protein
MGREEVEAQSPMPVCAGGGERVGPMDPTAIDDHHDLLLGFAKGGHPLMDVLAQFLGINMGHNLVADFGSPILDGPNDAEQHPAGDAAPRAILPPRLTCAMCFAFDLALAERTGGQPRALGAAPPAQPGEGTAPQDRCLFVPYNDLAPARAVRQGREVDRTIGEVS